MNTEKVIERKSGARWEIGICETWSDWTPRNWKDNNWQTFNFIELEIERTRYMGPGSFSIYASLLGVSVWVVRRGVKFREIMEGAKEALREARATPDESSSGETDSP